MPSPSAISVPVTPHRSRSWYQSELLRASLLASKPMTGPAERDLGDQLLEPLPAGRIGAGQAQVGVHDPDPLPVPSQRDRPPGQLILAFEAFGVGPRLGQRALPDVDQAQPRPGRARTWRSSWPAVPAPAPGPARAGHPTGPPSRLGP